jgi:hypothetical protein
MPSCQLRLGGRYRAVAAAVARTGIPFTESGISGRHRVTEDDDTTFHVTQE